MDREFKNSGHPINNIFEALKLLFPRWNGRTEKYLHTPRGNASYIEVAIFTGGQTGDCHSRSDYYLVNIDLARTIVDSRFVSSTYWGGYLNDEKHTLNDTGEKEYVRLFDDKVCEARSRLVPGVHGQSSLYSCVGVKILRHDEHPRHQQEYFAFRTPFNDQFAVFQDGEVLKVTHEKWD